MRAVMRRRASMRAALQATAASARTTPGASGLGEPAQAGLVAVGASARATTGSESAGTRVPQALAGEAP